MASSEAPSGRICLRAPLVITAGRRGLINDGAIILEGSRIKGVGTAHELAQEIAGAQVREYPNSTIIPGLIDAHCHLTLPADRRTYEQMALDPDEMLALIAVRNLQVHLASGVTTLRDNGGRNRVTFMVRDAINRGYFIGPRLLLSGRPLTHSYGHFYWCNGVADGADAIRAAVRKLVAEGADHIKIMASGGATAGNIPYYSSYTADELHVAVEAAHALGRLTTAHCRAKDSMLHAVEARLDCIEHAEFLVPGQMVEFGAGVPASGVFAYDPAVTDKVVESGMYVSFTFQAGGYDTLVELRTKREHEKLTPPDESRWRALEDHFQIKSSIFDGLRTDGMLPRLVISTDAGCFDSEFGRLHFGLTLAVQAGMSSQQAIEAATRIAADACGISSQVGTLDPGKEADLVVVRGNPLQRIEAVQDVAAVYKAGRFVGPPADHSLLAGMDVPLSFTSG